MALKWRCLWQAESAAGTRNLMGSIREGSGPGLMAVSRLGVMRRSSTQASVGPLPPLAGDGMLCASE